MLAVLALVDEVVVEEAVVAGRFPLALQKLLYQVLSRERSEELVHSVSQGPLLPE